MSVARLLVVCLLQPLHEGINTAPVYRNLPGLRPTREAASPALGKRLVRIPSLVLPNQPYRM
jgi:hypothetical protein